MEAEVEFEARPVWKPDDSSLVCDSCQVRLVFFCLFLFFVFIVFKRSSFRSQLADITAEAVEVCFATAAATFGRPFQKSVIPRLSPLATLVI